MLSRACRRGCAGRAAGVPARRTLQRSSADTCAPDAKVTCRGGGSTMVCETPTGSVRIKEARLLLFIAFPPACVRLLYLDAHVTTIGGHTYPDTSAIPHVSLMANPHRYLTDIPAATVPVTAYGHLLCSIISYTNDWSSSVSDMEERYVLRLQSCLTPRSFQYAAASSLPVPRLLDLGHSIGQRSIGLILAKSGKSREIRCEAVLMALASTAWDAWFGHAASVEKSRDGEGQCTSCARTELSSARVSALASMHPPCCHLLPNRLHRPAC